MTAPVHPVLSIIIVTSNNSKILKNCLDSIYQHLPKSSYEIIVVDNGSNDDTKQVVLSHILPCKLITSPINLKYAKGNNLGYENCTGELILLLNDDTIILPGLFDGLIEASQIYPNAGIIGPRLLNLDGTLQKSYFDFPSLPKLFVHLLGLTNFFQRLSNRFKNNHFFCTLFGSTAYSRTIDVPSTVDYVAGACMLIKRSVLSNRPELLDSSLEFYHEDCEIGYAMKKAGFDVIYLPNVSLIHLGGSSTVMNTSDRFIQHFISELQIYKKYEGKKKVDSLKFIILITMITRLILLPLDGWGLHLPSRYTKTAQSLRFSLANMRIAAQAYFRLIQAVIHD